MLCIICFWEDQGILVLECEGSKWVFICCDWVCFKMVLCGKWFGLLLVEIKDLIGMYELIEDEILQLMECLCVMVKCWEVFEQQCEDIEVMFIEIVQFEV